MAKFTFTLTGTTPLLMHADNIEFADELKAWRMDAKNKSLSTPGDDRSPAWTWIGGLYQQDGLIGMPADNLAVALRQAGARLPMKGAKTFKEESVSGLWIEEEYLPLHVNGKTISTEKIDALRDEDSYPAHIKAVEKLGFRLFMKRAAVGPKKHVRIRPMFAQGWQLSGTVDVTSAAIKPDVLQQLFALSGRVGLGSWRPGGKTPGRYGMYSAVVKPSK